MYEVWRLIISASGIEDPIDSIMDASSNPFCFIPISTMSDIIPGKNNPHICSAAVLNRIKNNVFQYPDK